MLSAGRQFKLKDRASGRTGRQPDPTIVALDDRLADRKTHSHPAGLGREHWFKNAIEVGLINSAAGIRDRDSYAIDRRKVNDVRVLASYDASSALMKKIEGGAPADAFLSADLQWMDYGVEKKVINESTRLNLLGNVLVLIAGRDSNIDQVDIKPGFDLAELAGGGRIATGDINTVPVGLYAKAALEKLGVWSSVEPKM